MLVKTFGSAVYGVEAISITVEVSVNNQANNIIIFTLVVHTHFYSNADCFYSINSTAKSFNQHG